MDKIVSLIDKIYMLFDACQTLGGELSKLEAPKYCYKSLDDVLKEGANHYPGVHQFLYQYDKKLKRIVPLIPCNYDEKTGEYNIRQVFVRKMFKKVSDPTQSTRRNYDKVLSDHWNDPGIKDGWDYGDCEQFLQNINFLNNAIKNLGSKENDEYIKRSDELNKDIKKLHKAIDQLSLDLFPSDFDVYNDFMYVYRATKDGYITDKKELLKYCKAFMDCKTCYHFDDCKRMPIENCNKYYHP